MKKIFLVLLMLLTLVGCGSNNQEPEVEAPVIELTGAAVNVGMLKGPTGMGMCKIIEENEASNTKNTYNFTIESDATVLNQMLIKGELDIAAIPTNAVAVLNNKTEGEILYLAVNTTGNLYILSFDESIKTLEDLKGKSVVSSGAAANPEYIMNMLLAKNGLKDEVAYTAIEGTDHAAALAEFMAGKYDAVMLPEPFVTQALSKDESIIKSVNLTEEFEKTFNSPMVLGTVCVRKTFAMENPDAVRLFLDDLEASINYVNNNVEYAAKLCDKFDIIKGSVAVKAIPNAGIVFMEGSEMSQAVGNFLSLLFAEAPQSIGGKEASDALFYTFN